MKFFKILLSAYFLSIFCGAYASFPGFYPKVSGSYMHFNMASPEGFLLETQLPAIQFSLTYKPNQSWSLEVAHTQLLSTPDFNGLLSKGALEVTYKSIFPLSRSLEFHIPIGATRIESKNNRYWAPKIGLGGSYSITQNILIEFNWISTYFLKIPLFDALNYPFSGKIEHYSVGIGFYLG